MSSLAANEVAADFRDALQDLKYNSRPEISNLTLIAKENTEYAQAISNELEQHIRTTRPDFKLPALYVLDSIVKNVGTPYTVYLGRGMYKTFMDAYLVMDQGTRRAMEGLLKTWKQPVPESMDPRPVFPADVTKDIENALSRMRSAFQQQRPQHALPARPPSTAAPQRLPVSEAWTASAPPARAGLPSQPPQVTFPLPPPNLPFGAPWMPSAPPNLQFPPPPPNFQFPTSTPPPAPIGGWMPPAPPQPPIQYPIPVTAPMPPATTNLAALLAQFKTSTPTPTAAPLTFAPQPLTHQSFTPQPITHQSFTPQSITHQSFNPQPIAHQSFAAPAVGSPEWIRTAFSNLRSTEDRLQNIARLYEAKPNKCATCGLRFENTNEGREKKARHMDWHFKVNDPDAKKRAVHRSWYIGEKEWIEYKEVDETAPPNENTTASGATKPQKQAKDRYVSVPQDPVLQHAPCAICQEKFETQWNVDANDFVWMDAVQIGPKIYHATCYEECYGIPMPSTPDSVLGKRKADIGGDMDGKKLRAF